MKKTLPAFCDELSKIAATKDAKPGLDAGALAGMLGAATIPVVANTALVSALHNARSAGELSPDDVKKLLSNMGVSQAAAKKKLPIKVIEDASGVFARTGGKDSHLIIQGPLKRPETIAHEAGHASRHLSKSKLTKLIHNLAANSGIHPLLQTAGAVAGLGMAALPADEQSAVVKAAPFVAGSAYAPRLIEEGGAHLRGYKGLKSLKKFDPAAMKIMRRNMLKAFGTYGSAAAAVVAPIATLSYFRGRMAKKSKKSE